MIYTCASKYSSILPKVTLDTTWNVKEVIFLSINFYFIFFYVVKVHNIILSTNKSTNLIIIHITSLSRIHYYILAKICSMIVPKYLHIRYIMKLLWYLQCFKISIKVFSYLRWSTFNVLISLKWQFISFSKGENWLSSPIMKSFYTLIVLINPCGNIRNFNSIQ